MARKFDELTDRTLPFISGTLMSLNFIIVWAIPIMGMGSIYKSLLKPFLQPIYFKIEQNKMLRNFASSYIYTKPEHADFFAMSLLVCLSCSVSIPTMFWFQLKYGYLPHWLIFAYYCSWVGIGGSIMGAAYGLAHKEGHYHGLYKKGIRDTIGHLFENWIGIFFGNVPWNFTTSHNCIHHRLDGGIGDTFYLWDMDRSSLGDFMLYVHRIFLHMVGYSSVKFFRAHDVKAKAEQLEQGMKSYWTATVVILAITRSPTFVFWMILQPLMCMSYFLALINIGFHGFLEYDEHGKHIDTIDATCIVDGEDDMFGEDDHMTHHYNTTVYFKDLLPHQATKKDAFKRTHASVFQKLSIVELSIFMLLGLWDKVAEHYVDYSGKLTKQEIIDMLRVRTQRKEISFEQYQIYLSNPTSEARKALEEEALQGRMKAAGTKRSDSPPAAVSAANQSKRF